MRKTLVIVSAAALLAAITAAPASAVISQTADVKVSPATGTGTAKGKNYVKLQAYLATRDAASVRPQAKANPVGKVVMSFPVGSTINPGATPGCNMSEYSAPSMLVTACAGSVIGTGWALLNTGSVTPSARDQLTGSPSPCNAGDISQYSRLYRNVALGCVPVGHIWVKITAYQGAILKSQSWKTTPGAVFNKFSKSGIIFANSNGLAPLAFGGNIKGNELTVYIPALNGNGAGAGELIGGWVLSDFYLNITKANYLKAGACPGSHRWNVSTKTTYSQLKGEASPPNPGSITVGSQSVCKA